MTDADFEEKIKEAKSIYVLGYCCIAYDQSANAVQGGVQDMSYRSICPCPTSTQICISKGKQKFMNGISDGSRYFGKRETIGYDVTENSATGFGSGVWGNEVTATASGLMKTETVSCDFERENGVRKSPLRGGTSESYQGSVAVSGEFTDCLDIAEQYEFDGTLHDIDVYEISGSLQWEGGSSASDGQAGFYRTYEFVEDGCSNDPQEFSQSNTDNPDGGSFFTVSVPILSNDLIETYSECPAWCDSEDDEGQVLDEVKGTECITFDPCGACVTSLTYPIAFVTDVDYAILWTNLRCGEAYKGSLQIQKREYLAFCEDVDDEDNWFYHEGVTFSFTADKPEGWFLEGGNLNVSEERFYEEDFSTSIYDYRDYFFEGYDDEDNEVWDTDADVVTPTRSLPKEQGYQFRVAPNARYIWRTSSPCPTPQEDLACPEEEE